MSDNNPVVNRRKFLEAAQALVKASQPGESEFLAVFRTFSQVLTDLSGEPVSVVIADQKPEAREPVRLPNGELQNFTIRIGGKLARCPKGCGCNVFHKPDAKYPEIYACNSCDVWFEGE